MATRLLIIKVSSMLVLFAGFLAGVYWTTRSDDYTITHIGSFGAAGWGTGDFDLTSGMLLAAGCVILFVSLVWLWQVQVEETEEVVPSKADGRGGDAGVTVIKRSRARFEAIAGDGKTDED